MAKFCDKTEDNMMRLDVWIPAAHLLIAGFKDNKFPDGVTMRLLLCRDFRAEFVKNGGLLVLAQQLNKLVQLDKKNHLENAAHTIISAHRMVDALKPQRSDKHGKHVRRAHHAFKDWMHSDKRSMQKGFFYLF